MQLTPKEHKRLKRLERFARLPRFWDYVLAAMFLVCVAIAIATPLRPSLPDQKMWFRTFMLLSGILLLLLKHQRDARFLMFIIKKLQE